ncbi:unnamed protein product [Amaranthus hypochondriacus]
MSTLSLTSSLNPSNSSFLPSSSSITHFLSSPPYPKLRLPTRSFSNRTPNTIFCCSFKTQKWITPLLTAGIAMALVGPSIAIESPSLLSSIQIQEPPNALSLPTWAVHVSSVAEWVIAMTLVWQYGDKPGNESWKGLSWGMVPLLGGAMCACTWHFFYNAESLEVLVALQAALTVLGNATMCIAAFRIYKTQSRSENL